MSRRGWSIAMGVVTLAAAARFLLSTVADPDLWGHIRFGQRTLSLGLERVDPFSYLSSDTWINHEILSEVAFGWVYDFAGGPGLIAMKAIIGLTIVALIYWHLIRRGSDPLYAGLLVLPAMILLIPGLATVRPQMFTFLFFTLTLLILHSADSGHPKWLWALPAVLAIWINFHGGVLGGVGVLGIWGIARVGHGLARDGLGGAWRALVAIGLVGLACAAALLANPYGWGLPEFLLRTATVPRPEVVEWRPLEVFSAQGFLYLGMIVMTISTIVRAPGTLAASSIAVLAALIVLPLSAVRHIQLFAIGVPILLADAFASAWIRREAASVAEQEQADGPPTKAPNERAIVGIATAVVALVLFIPGVRDARCIRIDTERSIPFPVRAVAWLEDAGARGNVATFFDWGEYTLWHLYPDVLVSMDGRRETIYSEEVFREYLNFQDGVGDWRGVLDRPETNMVMFPKGWPAYNLTQTDAEWVQVYEDELGGIFARAGTPFTSLTAEPRRDLPADGAGLCVP